MSDRQETIAEHLARVQNYRRGIPPPYGKKCEGRFKFLIIKTGFVRKRKTPVIYEDLKGGEG